MTKWLWRWGSTMLSDEEREALFAATRSAVNYQAFDAGLPGGLVVAVERIIADRERRAKTEAWSDAIGVVERQTNLTELVHFDKPSDFRKGVLTCIAALKAEAMERADAKDRDAI